MKTYKKFMCAECWEIRVESDCGQTVCSKCKKNELREITYLPKKDEDVSNVLFTPVLLIAVLIGCIFPPRLLMLAFALHVDKCNNNCNP